MHHRMIPTGQHQLPLLPYPYDALEPVISEKTLRIHHNKHHKSYVNGLNTAEVKLAEARKKNDFDNIKHWERELAFNGSGHILHSIYWTNMAPLNQGGEPGPLTMEQINQYFGCFDSFKEQFKKATEKVEASGWGVLIWNPAWDRLEILQSEKHQNLTQWGGIPILVCDVWEHAYYLEYQNERKTYIDDWWKLINWNDVEKRLVMAMDGKLPLERGKEVIQSSDVFHSHFRK
ncbi:Fe-Mn family superoxide dismutase [Natranaerovirga pectinivora]|uniref:Superoxide dismutase n=1 Tax=Natranaerovirga pectinivora TaxID=682400 RepID=A0A4R3MMF7_9FIRM|nr:superoxide dismutase [Natranaerovirga pectinivora]TCT16133.1 Fe-Mn family superoxide dismutase [Natranaerovirga pectinivora]